MIDNKKKRIKLKSYKTKSTKATFGALKLLNKVVVYNFLSFK